MIFEIKDIPQADKLEKVIAATEAVAEGASTEMEVAEAIGLSDRQITYYLDAARILGFIENNQAIISVTDKGMNMAKAHRDDKKESLRKAISENDLLKAIVTFVDKDKNGVNEQDISNFLLSMTAVEAHDLVPRRAKTLMAWLEYLDIIVEAGDKFVYNGNQSPEIEIKLAEESIYPANYSQEVDIKEDRFSVFELLRKLSQDKVLMNPDFQRNLVWKQFQKSQFIESIILNVPLPPLYFRKELDGKYIIVDGLQRTSTLKAFLSEEPTERFALEGLEALPQLNGKFFNILDDDLKTRVEDKSLLVYVLQPSVPMLVVYDIFNRINTGGTQLERQEIRNCIFIGKSTTLLKKLAESSEFKHAIDFGISPSRMKDREAVLRCLAFKIFNYYEDFNNSMDDFLERAMKKINRMSSDEIRDLESGFLRVMTWTFDFFGNKNFRLPTEHSRGRINIAIMESVSYFFWHSADSFLSGRMSEITHNYHHVLLKDPRYVESVRFSTGATSKVKERFALAQQILNAV
jgi:hypothetical protein